MANEQNLKPGGKPGGYVLTREQAKKGGLASAASKKRKKTLFEMAKIALELGVVNPKQRDALEKLGIDPDDLTNSAALAVSMLDKAMKGDVQAAKLIAEWGVVNAPQQTEREVDPLSAAFESLEGGADGIA